MSTPSLSFFPNPAIDHAVAGIGAGTAAVLCMHPLDLLKVKYQVDNTNQGKSFNPIRRIYGSLVEIKRSDGWRGLYRGLMPNIAGNAASWGLYFWLYTKLKRHMAEKESGSPDAPLTASRFLIASAEASAITAVVTNPIWVLKVRMFTTRPGDPNSYRGLWHGLYSIGKAEGWRGLWKGTSLALFGVSNGALQFMAYEEMKKLGFARLKRKYQKQGIEWNDANAKL
ncbi:hypothetical protein FRC03_009266, partial [Tulasnella sp. 419]